MNILVAIEEKLPLELLNIIAIYHHCEDCFKNNFYHCDHCGLHKQDKKIHNFCIDCNECFHTFHSHCKKCNNSKQTKHCFHCYCCIKTVKKSWTKNKKRLKKKLKIKKIYYLNSININKFIKNPQEKLECLHCRSCGYCLSNSIEYIKVDNKFNYCSFCSRGFHLRNPPLYTLYKLENFKPILV